jgi:uncharacterized membrane protein
MNRNTLGWVVMLLLALGVAGYATAVVFVPDARPPFVQSLLAEHVVAARMHFIGGAIALVMGAMQLNTRLRTRFIAVHRWLGRTYVLAVLTGGTAGFVLALHATAGPVAQSGFALLAVAWLGCTLNAYRHIRQRNPAVHRNWMIRSYALTLAAVTLRLYLPASQLAGLPFEVAYPAIAWLCWVPNLLVAEWLVSSMKGHEAARAAFTHGAS